MIEVIFLLALAFVWILFASISDFRTTEIPNWLNFSLVIFALAFRFFYSLFSAEGFGFFYQGLIGLGIFFVIAELLYRSKFFAGGDSRLMTALGAILPVSYSFATNMQIFVSYLFLFLACGAVYGILASVYLSLRNFRLFRKEFAKRYRKNLKFLLLVMAAGILIMILGFFMKFGFYFGIVGILVFIMPLLYIYTKSVDESCMVKEINPESLREGDLLYHDVKIGKKTIKYSWNGLTKGDIKLLRKRNGKVKIKQGIAFSIVFLASFLLLVYFYFINTGLWNSLW